MENFRFPWHSCLKAPRFIPLKWRTIFVESGWLTPSFATERGIELSVRQSLENVENVVSFVSTYVGSGSRYVGTLGPVFIWGVHGPPGCPLCSEKFAFGQDVVQAVKCRDRFHKVCLEGFLSHSKVCPVCYVRHAETLVRPPRVISTGAAAPHEAAVLQESFKDALAALLFHFSFTTSKYVKVHIC